MILVSGSIRHVRILAGFLGEGTSNDSAVVDNGNFHRYSLSVAIVFGNFRRNTRDIAGYT